MLRNRYFSNLSYLGIERVFRLIMSFSVGIYLARYLGPKDYGLLNYATSIAYIFGALCNLGLDDILVKEIKNTEDYEDLREILGSAWLLRFLSSIISLIIISLYSIYSVEDNETLIIIAIVSLSIFTFPFYGIDSFFQSKVQSKYIVAVQFSQQIFSAVLKVLGIILNFKLLYFASIIAVEALFTISGLILVYQMRSESILRWRFNKTRAKLLIKKATPILIASVSATLYLRIDQLMLKEILGNFQAGNYAAACKISEAWYFVPLITTATFFPAIIDSKKLDSQKKYEIKLGLLFTAMVLAGYSVALPLALFSDEIIGLLFGDAFELAAEALSIHVWGGVFISLGFAFNKYMIAEELEKVLLTRSIVGALINITLNFLLIPKYEILGAAYATLVSHIFANYLMDVFIKNTRFSFIMKSKSLLLLYLPRIKEYKTLN